MSLVILPVAMPEADHAAWLIRVNSANASRPTLLADVVPSEELAAVLRSQISAPPPGYTGEDFITPDPDVWGPHFTMLARKLTLAMHYRFMERPLGPFGRLLAWLVPNGHHDPKWDEMFEGVGIEAAPVYHGGEDLRDQMNLKYQALPDQGTMAVRLRMHEAMTIYGITAENGADSRLAEISEQLDRPFGPEVEAVAPYRAFSIADFPVLSPWKFVVDS